jgi:hypothetical protein
MTNIFCDTPLTGALEIQYVYEFYEEPRLFSAANILGNVFLVYWIGNSENDDTWLIIPISTRKLRNFELRNICIRDALLYQENTHFIKLRLPFDENESAETHIHLVEEINGLITLPRQGLFISSSPSQEHETVESSAYVEATHEIHVQKNSPKSKPLVLGQVSRILDALSALYDTISDSFDIQSRMQPVGARPGSFILSFNAENIEQVEVHLSELFRLMALKEDIIPFIESNNIDVSTLSELLHEVSANHSNFDLKRNTDAMTVLKLDAGIAKHYLNELNSYASSVISSAQVPQANDLKKLFEIVDKRANSIPLIPTELRLTQRQIQYYLHAASTLGFINNNGPATALGKQVSMADDATKMKITARSFQSSPCGWAWLNWSEVDDIRSLNADTATDFLLEKCATLADSTSKRRATTLKKWCRELTPYYTDW